jgi:hypothetical protein
MKRFSFFIAIVFLSFSVLLTADCKKTTEKKDCKTCKAYGGTGLVGQEEVCTDAEEQDFRSQYAGKEISCQ